MPNSQMALSYLSAQISTSDRFQGGLLGLWLVPKAISTGRNRASDEWDDWAAAVAFGFEHILAELSEPSPQNAQEKNAQKSPIALSTAPPQLPLWLMDIAELLRYHDSRERRWQRFAAKTKTPVLAAQAPEAQAAAEAQRLIFGDLLEFALSGCAGSPVDYLIQLQERFQPDEASSGPCRHYQGILTEMRAQLSQIWRSPPTNEPTLEDFLPHDLTAAELANHTDFIGGVLSALAHPESYCMAVQAAAQYGGIAALAAGVLAGARGGRSALPVLWQMGLAAAPEQAPTSSLRLGQEFRHQSGKQTEKQDDLDNPLNRAAIDRTTRNKSAQLSQLCLSDVTALANRLFEQWAGILPAASAPSTSPLTITAVKTARCRSAIELLA